VPLLADDALAVLDGAGAASAHGYGVSLGGAIALQLALDHPGRVRSLILGCTAASAEGVSRGPVLTWARSLLPAAALNRMAWKLLYGPDTPASRRAEDQQIVRRTRCSGRGRRGQLTGAASFDVTGRLAEIRIPALVLHGAQDRIVPAASARRLADGIAGARLVMFPDAGHAYITDVTHAANQQVLRFLGGISGPTGGSGTGAHPAASKADAAATIRRLSVDVQAADPCGVRRDHAERACHGQGHSGAGGHGAVGPPHHQPQAPDVAQPQ
jgi:pimeloyl-ACP methyl ester carboxylesterase